MTSYRRKHHKHYKHHISYSPVKAGEFSIPKETSVNDTQPIKNDAIKFELDPKNHSEIQALILKQAAVYRRDLRMGKGRAQIMAEDYVAANCITGTVTGQQLSSWLGNIHSGFRKPRDTPDTQMPEKPTWNGSIAVRTPIQEVEPVVVPVPLQDADTFNMRLSGKDKIIDPVLIQLVEKCRPIKVGQVWSFPVASTEEARALEAYMPRVAKLLGWRDGKKSHSFLFQIFPDRLKIKRLI